MTELDLSPEEITRIISFLGYGRLSAPVWFIGLEEGLGKMSSRDSIMNLKARASFEKTMDLREAHMRLQEGGRPIDIENKLPSTQVWQFMAKIMLAYNNEEWRKLESAKRYIQFQLGRCNGETFLTELSPIPSGRTGDKEWMTSFERTDPDLSSKMKQRKEDWKQALKENEPSLVVCYGLSRADHFAELLGVEWQSVSPKVYKSRDSKCLLVPFFGNGQMSHAVIERLLDLGLLDNHGLTQHIHSGN